MDTLKGKCARTVWNVTSDANAADTASSQRASTGIEARSEESFIRGCGCTKRTPETGRSLTPGAQSAPLMGMSAARATVACKSNLPTRPSHVPTRPASVREPIIEAVIQVTDVMPAAQGGSRSLEHTDMTRLLAWTPVEFYCPSPTRYMQHGFSLGWIPGGVLCQNGWTIRDQVRRGYSMPQSGQLLLAHLAPLSDRSFHVRKLLPLPNLPLADSYPWFQCAKISSVPFIGRWREQGLMSAVYPAKSIIDLDGVTPPNLLGNIWDNVATMKQRWTSAASFAAVSPTDPGDKLNWESQVPFTAVDFAFDDLPDANNPKPLIGILAGALTSGVGGCVRHVFADGSALSACGSLHGKTKPEKFVFACLSENKHFSEIVMARVLIDNKRKYNDLQNKASSENIGYALLHEFGHVLGLSDSPGRCNGSGIPGQNIISHTKSIMFQSPPPTIPETWTRWTENFLLDQIDKDIISFLYPGEKTSDKVKSC